MIEPIWVLEETVIDIHLEQIAEHGGSDGIRDHNLLLSALAASYGFGIIKNHPFIDGNKRVGLVVCYLFLELNGLKVIASSLDSYKIIMSLAEGGITEEAYSIWLENNCQPIYLLEQ